MIISDAAVRYRVTVFVLTFLIVVGGIYSYRVLPREAAPEVVIPNVIVTTNYRGVSPEDMELSVTKKIEDKLRGLKNVKKISSSSSEGSSVINVEFITGTNIDEALQRVKDKVDLAKADLPVDLDEDPSVQEVNTSEMPVLVLALSGPTGPQALRGLADDLKDEIEGVPGVLEVVVVGGLEREIHIEVSPGRMALYQVPFTALQAVVQNENANISGGTIRTSEGRFQLRLEGEFETAAQAEGIVVKVDEKGAPVYLRDIAKVVDGFKDTNSTSRLDGQDSVTLYVKKRAGENVPELIARVDAVLAAQQASWPPGTIVTRLQDFSKMIRDMVSDLENNMISGFLLVIAVVFLVMGVRNAVLISLSIPFSMLLGFMVLRGLDITLNMVVLFSLTLVLGMLVDNAIVIVENIYRFMQQGVGRVEAAMRATSEVAYPITTSALTTIAAFLPLLWWPGIMGSFMHYLPATVIIVLSSCLFVALVINPAMAAACLRVVRPAAETRSADELQSGADHHMLTQGGWFIRGYRRLLIGALGANLPRPEAVAARGYFHRFARRLFPLVPRLAVLLIAALALVFFVEFWFYRVGLRTPTEFFPAIDPESATVNLNMPEGADLAYCNSVVEEVEKRVFDGRYSLKNPMSYAEISAAKPRRTLRGRPYLAPSDLPNAEHVYARVDSLAAGGGSLFQDDQPNQVVATYLDVPDRTESTKETVKRVAARVRDVSGAKITVEEPRHGPPTGAPVSVELVGDDFQTLGRLARETRDLLRGVPFTRNIRDDFTEGTPTLQVRVDRKRAALLGLSTQTIGFLLKAAINGMPISTFRAGKKDYDIVMRFQESERHSIDALRQVLIPSPGYGLVPLTTVARMEYTGGLGSIRRINHERVVTVKADVDPTRTTGVTARQAAEAILAGDPFFTPDRLLEKGKTPADFSAAELPEEIRARLASYAPRPGVVERLRRFLGGLVFSAAARSREEETRTGAELVQALNSFVRDFNPLADRPLLDRLLAQASAGPKNDPALSARIERARKLILRVETDAGARERLNRLMLEMLLPGILAPSTPGLEMPPGASYRFAGEFEFQKEASDFLSWAALVTIGLIFLILVFEFNSLIYPLIICSSVVLSLGGVFCGLGLFRMPFGIIMSGVGVISLAGVVVNNAIVLLDYTLRLRRRGMAREDAIVAAGATRLRPVLLTAVTAILGLVPMAVGISIDFHPLLQGDLPVLLTSSESSQWWSNMAVIVIFGLALATMLTLLVVPVLFSLLDDIETLLGRFFAKLFGFFMRRYESLRERYWRLFWRLTGLAPRPGEPGSGKDRGPNA
ncbi:MAG: efflux RND transporter permease subunit [Planctomycetota bacterium]